MFSNKMQKATNFLIFSAMIKFSDFSDERKVLSAVAIFRASSCVKKWWVNLASKPANISSVNGSINFSFE